MEFDKIQDYSSAVGFTERLDGMFLVSILTHNTSLYYNAIYKVILLGIAYRLNPAALSNMEIQYPDLAALEKDINKVVSHTNLCLTTAIRNQDISETARVIKECIVILFEIGMKYDGTDISGEQDIQIPTLPNSIGEIENKDDNEIDNFLRTLLGE